MDIMLQYIQILPGSDLPGLARMPSRIVFATDQLVEPLWQTRVSQWLISIGGLYVMAWGNGCSSWDCSVDLANAEAFGYGEIPENEDAMTTWHDSESLCEVMWFAKNCAMHPTVELSRTLLIHVSAVSRELDFLAMYADA